MDFQARFKGRTNFVPKEGISSLILEASNPIDKKSLLQSVGSPKSLRINKNMASYANLFGSSISPSKKEVLSKIKLPLLELEKYEVFTRNKRKSSSMIQFQPHSETYFPDHDISQLGYNLSYFTPQNKIHTGKISTNNDNLFLSNRIPNAKTIKTQHKRTIGSKSEVFAKVPDVQGFNRANENLKQKFDDQLRNLNLKPTQILSNKKIQELQQNRISRMNFIERQEQLLSKYKRT